MPSPPSSHLLLSSPRRVYESLCSKDQRISSIHHQKIWDSRAYNERPRGYLHTNEENQIEGGGGKEKNLF